jgi:hypothetical protein
MKGASDDQLLRHTHATPAMQEEAAALIAGLVFAAHR